MFWLSVCELFRPFRLFCNPYASLVSLDLLFAARPHIYFYHLSSWFSTVVIGQLYDNCHRQPCLSLSLLRVLSGKFCSRFQLSKLGSFFWQIFFMPRACLLIDSVFSNRSIQTIILTFAMGFLLIVTNEKFLNSHLE